MPQAYFSQNMEILRQIFPQLAEELGKEEDEGDQLELKIEAAANGSPTLLCAGLYLHSRRDPQREAERLVEGAAATGAAGSAVGSAVRHGADDPALVLGFGLGYAATALDAKFPARPIIVVEKRPELLKKALEARDLRAFLGRKHLVFVLGGDGGGVTAALSLFESSPGVPPLVLQNRALCSLDEDWYAAVEGRISAYSTRTNVNRATQKRFGKRWIANLSKNLAAIRDIPGISRIEGLLSDKDIPVFLAAAGPSLDAIGPLLGEIHKRCLVMAVDTSLRFLCSRGIESDFVLSVDPQFWNSRHLDRLSSGKTRLIAESAVYPPVLRQNFGGVFLCSSFFPLGRYIEEKLEPKGALGAGGSVSTSAWDFLRFLGAKTIWIGGLDLSFPELKTHFRGAAFEEKCHSESGRFFPAESWNFRVLRDGQPFLAKGRGGGTVLTDKRLSLYASWFENRFGQFPEIKNYAIEIISAGGLEIRGLENRAAGELLALAERRDEIDKLLSGAYMALEEDFSSAEALKKQAESYEKAKKSLIDGLGELKKISLDAAQQASAAIVREKMGHLEQLEREKVLKALDAATKSITGSTVKEIAGFLFPETEGWEAELNAKDLSPLERHLEFSGRFYRELSETLSFNLLKLGD